jgi:hypothetical protein
MVQLSVVSYQRSVITRRHIIISLAAVLVLVAKVNADPLRPGMPAQGRDFGLGQSRHPSVIAPGQVQPGDTQQKGGDGLRYTPDHRTGSQPDARSWYQNDAYGRGYAESWYEWSTYGGTGYRRGPFGYYGGSRYPGRPRMAPQPGNGPAIESGR